MGRRSPNAKPVIRVSEVGRAVSYRNSAHESHWQIPLDHVVLFAEYTTDEGPLVDDYFLVFVTKVSDTPQFVTASFYSEGLDDVLTHLAAFWNSEIQLTLQGSTDWASRIVWPANLAGHEYFECKEVQPGTFFQRLRKLVLGPSREYVPCQAVRSYLASS